MKLPACAHVGCVYVYTYLQTEARPACPDLGRSNRLRGSASRTGADASGVYRKAEDDGDDDARTMQ